MDMNRKYSRDSCYWDNNIRLLEWHAIFALEEFQEGNRALSWVV